MNAFVRALGTVFIVVLSIFFLFGCFTFMLFQADAFSVPASEATFFQRINPWNTIKIIIEFGFVEAAILVNKYLISRYMSYIITAVLLVLFIIVMDKLFILAVRALQLKHKDTKLYGSASLADKKELKKKNLLNNTGIIFCQTDEAEFKQKRLPKPSKRKFGNQSMLYNVSYNRWAQNPTTYVQKRYGDIIASALGEHAMIFGTTGGGKGVCCHIPTLFAWQGSIVDFSPKSEEFAITSNHRSKFSRAMKFDPEHPKESFHINPLIYIQRGGSTIAEVQDLAETLCPDANSSSQDPYWNTQGKRLFSGICIYILYCMPKERKNLASVYAFFYTYMEALDEDEKDLRSGEAPNAEMNHSQKIIYQYVLALRKFMERFDVETYKEDMIAKHGADFDVDLSTDEARKYLDENDKITLEYALNTLTDFTTTNSKEFLSIKNMLTSRLTVLSDPNVQEITSRSDFRFEDFQSGVENEHGQLVPLSLYNVCSLSGLKRLAPLLRIVYQQMFHTLTKNYSESELKRNFQLLFYFDEFYLLGKMDFILEALTLARGYKMTFVISTQTVQNLVSVYGDANIFEDNTNKKVVLQVNSDDTAKKIEAILGTENRVEKNYSYSGDIALDHRNETISYQQVGRSVMTSEEIRRMDGNDCIFIATGPLQSTRPYKAKLIRYYADKRFSRLYKDRRGNMLPPADMDENRPYERNVKEGQMRYGVDPNGWFFVSANEETFEETEKGGYVGGLHANVVVENAQMSDGGTRQVVNDIPHVEEEKKSDLLHGDGPEIEDVQELEVNMWTVAEVRAKKEARDE